MFLVYNTFNILFTRLLAAKAIQSQSGLGSIVLHRRIKACTTAGSAASQPPLKLSTSKQSWEIRGIPASVQIRAKFHLVAQPHRGNGLFFSSHSCQTSQLIYLPAMRLGLFRVLFTCLSHGYFCVCRSYLCTSSLRFSKWLYEGLQLANCTRTHSQIKGLDEFSCVMLHGGLLLAGRANAN